MKFDFLELTKANDLFSKELMFSMPDPQIGWDGMIDVKLIINGKECEPAMLKHIFSQIESIIESRALELLHEKYQQAENDANELAEIISQLNENVQSKINELWKK